jgi:NADH dehydrogenase/NADH:ubiquinone oxidoreductase subunit G
MKTWLGDTSQIPRTTPAAGTGTTFSESEAHTEADRCRLCGCETTDICALRRYAIEYGAEPGHYRGDRKPVRTITSHPDLIFEEGKCIACGLCVAIAKQAGEKTGLAFVGRGFDVRVAVPFGRELAEGLQKAAEAAAKACPTGAIHHRRP